MENHIGRPELWNVLSELETMCREDADAHAVRQRKYGELRSTLMSLIRKEVGSIHEPQPEDRDVYMTNNKAVIVPRTRSSESRTITPSGGMQAVYRHQTIKTDSKMAVLPSIFSENIIEIQNSLASVTSTATLVKEDDHLSAFNNGRKASISTHLPDAASSIALRNKPNTTLPQANNRFMAVRTIRSADVIEDQNKPPFANNQEPDAFLTEPKVAGNIGRDDTFSCEDVRQDDVLHQEHDEDFTRIDSDEEENTNAQEALNEETLPELSDNTITNDKTKSVLKPGNGKKVRPSRPIGPLSLTHRTWKTATKERKSLPLHNSRTVVQKKANTAPAELPEPTEIAISQASTVITSTPTSAETEETSIQPVDKQPNPTPPTPPQKSRKRPRRATIDTIINDSHGKEGDENPLPTTATTSRRQTQTAPTTPAATIPRKSNLASTSSVKSRVNRVRFDENTHSPITTTTTTTTTIMTATKRKGKQQQEQHQDKRHEHEHQEDHRRQEEEEEEEAISSRPRRRCSTNKIDYYKPISLPEDDEYETLVEKVVKRSGGRQRSEDVVYVAETRKRRVDSVDGDDDDNGGNQEDEQAEIENENDVMMPEA